LFFLILIIPKEELLLFKELFGKGEFLMVIGVTVPFEKILEDHTYAETGQKNGNLGIKVVA